MMCESFALWLSANELYVQSRYNTCVCSCVSLTVYHCQDDTCLHSKTFPHNVRRLYFPNLVLRELCLPTRYYSLIILCVRKWVFLKLSTLQKCPIWTHGNRWETMRNLGSHHGFHYILITSPWDLAGTPLNPMGFPYRVPMGTHGVSYKIPMGIITPWWWRKPRKSRGVFYKGVRE